MKRLKQPIGVFLSVTIYQISCETGETGETAYRGLSGDGGFADCNAGDELSFDCNAGCKVSGF